ncbi:MAG: protease modulator HflK, partial [Thiofilum sp.]
TQLVTEYQKAPAVTRERLYLDTMEKVLGGSRKVIVDNQQQNILYLPLEQGTSTSNLKPLPAPPASFTSQNSDSNGITPAPASVNPPNTSNNIRQERSLIPSVAREGR